MLTKNNRKSINQRAPRIVFTGRFRSKFLSKMRWDLLKHPFKMTWNAIGVHQIIVTIRMAIDLSLSPVEQLGLDF